MDRARPWLLEAISRSHERSQFDCGSRDLDEFLQQHARQNEERGISRTFVAVLPGKRRVLGYFTIRAGELRIRDITPEHAKRLPKYPVPSLHLARLAVDRSAQGKGLGEYLLMMVLERAVRASAEVGVYAVEVRAGTDVAKRFYERYGFVELGDDPLHLYLTIATAHRAFEHEPR